MYHDVSRVNPAVGTVVGGADSCGKRAGMSLVRPITRADIKGPALYAGMRDDFRRHIIALKKPRRIVIGDRVSLVFENRHTLTLQIEEMLRAESITKDEQIREEIAVYNEMMPTPDSLSATLFIELPPEADPVI